MAADSLKGSNRLGSWTSDELRAGDLRPCGLPRWAVGTIRKTVLLPRPSQARQPSGALASTPEEISRTSIEIIPVERGRFRLSREFPATIQPNENELAEVTTLIRGRVVKVHVDVGADVKKGDLLALLHSTDLGLAEGAYLKATARLYEADLSYRRAKDLYEHRAMSLAEFQRREAEMRTARAEMHETQNRLELLGVPATGNRAAGP